MKVLYYIGNIIGVRPDIALLFLIIFVVALFICILIAKQNYLFNFSRSKVKRARSKEVFE